MGASSADSAAFIPPPILPFFGLKGASAVSFAWAASISWYLGMEYLLDEFRPKPLYQVATLNLLGDGFSPFEFLPNADEAFMADYNRLEKHAVSLTWADVQEYLNMMDQKSLPGYFLAELTSLKVHSTLVQNNLKVRLDGRRDKIVWSYFQPHIFERQAERVLSNDNKVKCQQRLNMLTLSNARIPRALATRYPFLFAKSGPFTFALKDGSRVWTPKAEQQWHLNLSKNGAKMWTTLFSKLLSMPDGYLAPAAKKDGKRKKDGMLALFDFISNIICAKNREEHIRNSAKSIFNPVNIQKNAEQFFKVASTSTQGLPVVLGIQEWPEDTERQNTWKDVLTKHGMGVVAAEPGHSVAVVHSNYLTALRLPLKPRGIFERLVARAGRKGELRDDKSYLAKFVNTTAKKTMAVRVSGRGFPAMIFINVHAKQPKTRENARLLAEYIQTLGDSLPGPWVAVGDLNLAIKSGTGFEEVFPYGNRMVPNRHVITTAKFRSLLQGQTDDKEKVQVPIKESKDRLMAGGGLSFYRDAMLYPDISKGRTLPQVQWPSDHCIVMNYVKRTATSFPSIQYPRFA